MPKPVTIIPALALLGAPIAAHSPMPPRIERPQILITEQADARPDEVRGDQPRIDDAGQPRLDQELRRLDEGLETGQFDLDESHGVKGRPMKASSRA